MSEVKIGDRFVGRSTKKIYTVIEIDPLKLDSIVLLSPYGTRAPYTQDQFEYHFKKV